MGEATDDARRQVELAREELDETVGELRARGGRARARVRRLAPLVAGGMLAGASAVVTTVVLVRRRRQPGVAAAARRQRDRAVEALAERIAAQQARAERRANPIWRRTLAKGLEAAAAAGGAAAVRTAASRAG